MTDKLNKPTGFLEVVDAYRGILLVIEVQYMLLSV